ncbi:MAG: TonB-dependent receptor [Bacteroidetes bacterium]|nr:MAG: TonB-dependent receptor [Bacteroidota bacterium]
MSLGINAILYGIDRGSFEPLGAASLQQSQLLGQEQAVEGGIFLSDEWEISPRLAANVGLRYNWYRYFGPQSVYLYEAGQPKEPGTIVDSLSFGPWDNIQTYSGLDYRASLRFMLNEHASLKASVNQLHQYIFLLSNTIALAPSDKWKLTDYHLKPMVGQQLSLGWYGSALQKRLNLSVEGYYKRVENLVEFKDGAELLINAQPEQDVLQGDLRAYGIEFMVKKPYGRLNGWVSYTFARSIVQVDGPTPDEQTNFGDPYPANWDKPHALNLVSNYKFSRRLSLSGNLVYATGRPATYPTALYNQNSAQVIAFSTRNAYRIPDYWRVDLSLRIEGNFKAEKLIHGSWNISIYNLLGRNNAYSVFFKPNELGISGYRVSIFAMPIFSIAYDFKLGNYAN